MKIVVSFIAIFIILIGIPFLLLPENNNKAVITLLNDSNTTLYDINISLYRYKQYYYFYKLPPNNSKTITFRNFGDTHYIICFKSNNTIIQKERGYLTN